MLEAIQQVDVKFMVVVQAKGQGGDHNGKSRKRNHHAENQVRELFVHLVIWSSSGRHGCLEGVIEQPTEDIVDAKEAKRNEWLVRSPKAFTFYRLTMSCRWLLGSLEM